MLLSHLTVTYLNNSYTLFAINGARGGVVVKALRYKPAGRGFDSRWCQDFSPLHNPGVDSASNRKEYQVCFLSPGILLGVKAAGA